MTAHRSRADAAPRLRVREVRLRERPVRLRIPFRYGQVTLREGRQAFVEVRIETDRGTSAGGVSAEMLAPKWFDKDPRLSDADNVDQLRLALDVTARRYVDAALDTAFGLMAGAYREIVEETARHGLPPLAAAFGPALVDRAVLDALCRSHGLSFFDATRANLAGVRPEAVAPDLAGFDADGFLASLTPRRRIHARHTVGLSDPVDASERGAVAVDDGLPDTLADAIGRDGHRYFKLKIGGDPRADALRLADVARILDAHAAPGYRATLDGNEQYESAEPVVELLERMRVEPTLMRLYEAIVFVEQPIARHRAFEVDVASIAAHRPVIVDESDDGFDAFVHARAAGYAGVSSKQCKGVYKSLVNAARCADWNSAAGGSRHFLSGEDLTCQAGVAVQQDLALVALLGLEHVERNGHYFGGAMPGAAPEEHRAFIDAHADVYENVGGHARLRIVGGEVALDSLGCTGFAHAADPDLDAMTSMPTPDPGPAT